MLDDHVILFGEQGVSNKSLVKLFTEPQHLFYRPVGHLFLMASYDVFGHCEAAYHWANLLLFSGVGILFFYITYSLFQNTALAWLTALLYCVHPINSMLVNYVTVTVITTFVLTVQASFLLFIKYLDHDNKALYYGSILFFVLSLFSHEASLVYPLYLVGVLYFLRQASLKRIVGLCWPYAFLSVLYFLFRLEFFSLKAIVTAVAKVSPLFSVYISSVSNLIGWYFSKLIFPKGILFLWTGQWDEKGLLLAVPKFFAVLLVVGWLIFRYWKDRKAFALAVFVIGFIPAFWATYAHFPFTDPFIEPHWFYFSSFGFFLLLADGILSLKGKINGKVWGVILLVVFGWNLFFLRQNNVQWKSQESYCRYWISLNQGNMTPFYGLGKALLAKGDYPAALELFEKGM